MRTSRLLRFALCVSITAAWNAFGASIPGLFNTGVDDNRALLPAGTADPHYTLIQSADAAFPGPITRVVNEGFPIGTWLVNGPNSKWIAPQAPQGTGNQPGNYTYRTTFNLAGLEPGTAVITGLWSSDNAAPDILINGISTGITYDGNFAVLSGSWTISSGFIEGTNTLDFIVNNAAPGINPTGFRAELSGTADPLPPPGTPPSITRHPTNMTVGIADGAGFSVGVFGSKPLTYQWRRNSTPISGATNSSYFIGSVSTNDAGSYDVIVSNSAGSITSASALLTIVYFSPAQLTYEPLGPSSRRTGLVISEIMYHPPDRPDGKNLEFIELYNSNPFPEEIGGYRLSGDIEFTFPTNTTIAGNGFIVVAPSPADIQSAHNITGVLGGFTNSLPNGSGTIRLRKRSGAILLEVNYADEAPWPVAADGTGHSIVLAKASYGENNGPAWAHSAVVGGSPGAADAVPAGLLENVVLNELAAHLDDHEADFIELFNTGPVPVDISGCYLTDSTKTNKFRIPSGTVINPSAFAVFATFQLTNDIATNELGFALRAAGETIYFWNSNQTRVIDAVKWENQGEDFSLGRYPDGSPYFFPGQRTRGTNNAVGRGSEFAEVQEYNYPVVINEIMFNPISGDQNDQFIELHNFSTNDVPIGGWRLTGGVRYEFPSNTILPALGFVVVGENASQLIAHYPNLSVSNTFGNWDGTLAKSGETIVLRRPQLLNSPIDNTTVLYPAVDEVTYEPSSRWTRWSDGGGSSLELIDARSPWRLAPNWADSDESSKGLWVTVEKTGVLDLAHPGNVAADQLQIFLLGPGEALVDDVEVIPSGGANRVSNPGFENGTNGWFFQGTHRLSSVETNGGYTGGKSLHVRATTRGDHVANRIRTPLTSPIAQGTVATIRAKVKWLRGHPEILFRLKGNHLEAYGQLQMRNDLGTPGAPNSRARANGAPIIFNVTHKPTLPAAGEVIRVEARIADPDGIQSVLLKYRIDPSTALSTAPMNDYGTNGDLMPRDGIFTGVIPAQSNGKLVAFRIEASDAFSNPATNQFPAEAPVRECLVRIGESIPPGPFGTYRFWMTQASHDFWATREKMSNEGIDATFVYGTRRIVYNANGHYSGSSYTAPTYTTPTGALCGYDLEFPDDDRVLGENHFTLDWPIRDDTDQREQLMFWFLDQYGLPNMYRRYINLFVNGVKRGTIYDDVQQPGGDAINEFFPNDNNGALLKTDCWNEFDDAGNRIDPCILNSLDNYLSGGVKKTARYRWNWRPRAIQNTANDFSDLFALVDAVNTQGGGYQSAVEGLVDVEHWMRTFAMNDLASFWDAFGNPNAKNTYLYKPANDTWKLFSWDFDVGLGVFNDPPTAPLFDAGVDPNIVRMYNYPAFVRSYWRALDEAMNGFFRTGSGTPVDTILDSKFAVFQANGIALNGPAAIKTWIDQRRAFILGQLNSVSNVFNVNGTNSFSTNRNLIAISGTAPVRARTIAVNGISYPITWTSVTGWRLLVPLAEGSNVLNITAFDLNGQALSNSTRTLTVNYTDVAPSPRNVIVFNEIMYDPVVPDAAFVEIFNTSTNYSFDLSNWRINGLDYIFPPGSIITNRQFLLLANDRASFARAHGTAIPVFDEFSGNLQNNGETLTLLKPAASSNQVDLVVDRVRYESVLPWSTNANGTGSSLQLIDPNQENARVGNWFSSFVPAVFSPEVITPSHTNDGWRFVTATGTTPGGNATNIQRLLIYLGEAGSAIIDDVWLVRGSQPEVGTNLVTNGDFETPLTNGLYTHTNGAVITNGWIMGTNYTDTVLVSDLTHSGSGAMKIIGTSPGGVVQPSFVRSITQNLTPIPLTNAVHTLSFWYWATNSATNLYVRVLNSGGLSSGPANGPTNINVFITPSNYIPPQLISLATNSLSPGAANQLTTNLPPFPPLWLNEVQAENVTGIVDNNNQHEPWVELYNASTNTVSLDGLYLSSNYTNLLQWAFPAGASIGPTQFLVIFCDGQSAQTSGGQYHTSFRLPAGSGSIALSRIYSNGPVALNGPQVLDYINYSSVRSDRSYGSSPDGQPFDRLEFFYVTPGAPNDGRSAPIVVFINEWLAANTNSITDPADGDFDDWFELYNPSTNAVDLVGYTLTDVLSTPGKYVITTNGPHVIPGRGYLLVWADNETGQNVSGGVPRTDLHVNFQLAKAGEALGLFAPDGSQIDAVTFTNQVDDVSVGRYPDGTPTIVSMPGTASPRTANYINGGNPDQPTFTSPVRIGTNLQLNWSTVPGRRYAVEYKDNLTDPNWTPLTTNIAVGTSLSFTHTTLAPNQRFFRIRVVE